MTDIGIDTQFDSGNIEVLSISGASARLALRKDNQSDFAQWFHFRVHGAADRELELKITGLENSAYPAGWPDYDACVSEDRDFWGRAASSYDKDEDGGTLTIRYTPGTDIAWFAYFAPYSMERHHASSPKAPSEGVEYRRLGGALDDRSIAWKWETASGRSGWQPRQRRALAEWWMEGALEILAIRPTPSAAPCASIAACMSCPIAIRRLAPGPSAHQCGRDQSQPRMGGTERRGIAKCSPYERRWTAVSTSPWMSTATRRLPQSSSPGSRYPSGPTILATGSIATSPFWSGARGLPDGEGVSKSAPGTQTSPSTTRWRSGTRPAR